MTPVRGSAIAAAVVALASGCRDPSSSASAPVGRGSAPLGYLKGQLHVHSNRSGDALVVEVADETPGDLEIAFIGAGGRVLDRQRGRSARFALAAARGGYVRATLADARGHRAWLQPIRVE